MPRQAFPPDDLRCYRDEDTLTVSQAAIVLNLGKYAIRKFARAGVLEFQLRGRELHVFASSVRAFLDSPKPTGMFRFQKGAAQTREASGKHLLNAHACPRCGKVTRGNAHARHVRACGVTRNLRQIPDQKHCRGCGTVKPISAFVKVGDSWAGDCRECRNAYKRRTSKAYPWSCHALNPKFRARQKLRAAIKRGIIVRPVTCPQCGTEGMVEAHHENYDEPYAVTWLCKPCHVAHHRKQRAA